VTGAAARGARRAELRTLDRWEGMVADYATTGVTLGPHPLKLLRPHCQTGPCRARTRGLTHGTRCIGGLVVARQRPGTAGDRFVLLEDEFGTINLIVPPPVYERRRLIVRMEPRSWPGRLERLRRRGAINVYVRDLEPLVAPEDDAADVVALADGARRAAGAAAAAASDFRGALPFRASRQGGGDEPAAFQAAGPGRFPPRMTTLIFVLTWCCSRSGSCSSR
jgi:error-prone DNA polymerase